MDPALRTIARRQCGIFTHAQARRVGMSEYDIQWRLVHGDWVVVLPRIYACAGTPLGHGSLSWAAVMSVGRPVALGRRTAAAALQLDRAPVPVEEEVDVVVPRPRRIDVLPAPLTQRMMQPSRFEAVSVTGLPVTPAALTLRELGMVLPRDWVRDMVQHALRRRSVTFSALSRQLGRGWPGAAALRDVLLEVAPGFQVVWEGRLHSALRSAGLELQPQVEVSLGDGTKAVLDLGSRALRFGVEVDGLVAHLDRFASDRRRDRALRRAGWHIEHVAVREIQDDLPSVTREITAAARLRARALGLPDPLAHPLELVAATRAVASGEV